MILNLTDGQKSLYDMIYKEMSKGSYIMKLPLQFPKENVNMLIKLVLGDHPELINYDNGCVYFSCMGTYNSIRLKPVFSEREFLTAQRRFEEESISILRKCIKPGMNLIQKVLAIHDCLTSTVVYDEEEPCRRDPVVNSHTAYGAIVEKKAVCEGFAYAFCHLAKKVGIKSTVVNGIVDGEPHAWNMIKIGPECYHLDVTWDVRNRVDSSVKSYDYFCLTDSDLKMRNWDKKIYPECTSSRYNYFNVTKSFAHDRQQLREILLRQYSKYKSIYLKYDFLHMTEKDTVDYICNEFTAVARANGLAVGHVAMFVNHEQSIFTLFTK